MRTASLVLVVTSTVLVFSVHLVADLGPVDHRLSEYVDGRGGFLMTAAFLTLGAGIAALGLAIAGEKRGRRGWVVAALLVGAGTAMTVSGLFPTDPGAETTAELVHSTASAMATIAVIGASLLWSWSVARDPGSRMLAALGLVLGIASTVLHETAATGISQRALWLVLVAWLLVAGLRLPPNLLSPTRRKAAPTHPSEDERQRSGQPRDTP